MSLYVKDLGSSSVSNSNLTHPITLSATPAAGNTVTLEECWNGTAVVLSTGLSDSKGNTWARVTTDASTASNIEAIHHWLCLQDVAPLVSGDVVTVTFNSIGTTTMKIGMLKEWAGKLAVDKNGSAHTGSNSTTVTSATTAATVRAVEVVLSSFVTGTTQASWTKDAAYSLPTLNLVSNASGRALLSEYLDTVATGAQTATGTTATTCNYASVITTFYVKTSSPAPSPRNRLINR